MKSDLSEEDERRSHTATVKLYRLSSSAYKLWKENKSVCYLISETIEHTYNEAQ